MGKNTITDEQIIEAVRKEATSYLNQPVHVWDLEKQGWKPEEIEELNIDEHFRVVVTIKGLTITEREDENGVWYVDVDATPEVADVQTFEVIEMADGTLDAQWHGC